MVLYLLFSFLRVLTFILSLAVFIFQVSTLILFFRGEGREKEGKKHQCVVASLTPPRWGPGPQPRRVPWLGIEPVTLWFIGQCSTTEPHSQGSTFIFKILFILERRESMEKKKAKKIDQLPLARPPSETRPKTQVCALTENQTGDPHWSGLNFQLFDGGLWLPKKASEILL